MHENVRCIMLEYIDNNRNYMRSLSLSLSLSYSLSEVSLTIMISLNV